MLTLHVLVYLLVKVKEKWVKESFGLHCIH